MLTKHTLLSPAPQRLARRIKAIAIGTAVAGVMGLSALTASGQTPASVEIAPNAPDQHTVVRGDTLWGISGKFLKQPWRWPDVWRMNREQIKHPHWIYPGQIIVLDRNAPGGPRLSIQDASESGERPVVRLGPQVRSEAREFMGIPSLRPEVLNAFMLKNLVIGAEALDTAPQIVKAVGERVAFSTADTVYAVGVKPEMGKVFQIFRKERELRDPAIAPRPWYLWRHNVEDSQIIGYEATYLGDAKVLRDGDVAKMEIASAKQEIRVGDYLIPAPPVETIAYIPHAPEAPISGFVVTLPSGVSEAGKTNIVTLNLGARHGLEVGHVLAVFKPTETFSNPRFKDSPMNWVPGWPKQPNDEPATLQVPEERVALVFVYRVFEGVSYAMVANAGRETVRAGYIVRNPN